MDAKVEIKTEGPFGKIIVDGIEIQDKVTGFELIHKAGELPTLTIKFSGVDINVISQQTQIEIPKHVLEFFSRYVDQEKETACSID